MSDANDFNTGPVAPQMLNTGNMPMLQAFLASMGYPPGPNDGLWGPATKAAWELFAESNGLPLDAIDGATWHIIAGGGDRAGLAEGPGGDTTVLEQTGGATSGSAGDGVLDPDEILEIQENYPTLAYLLDEPEIGPLLVQAVEQGWDSARLIAQMEATEWWQTTTSTQRQFDASEARDPASVANDIATQTTILESTFSSYGITPTAEELSEMARTIVRNGTSTEGVLRMVGARARQEMQGGNDGSGGDAEGQLAAIVQQLQSMSRAYHLGHSTDQLEEWAIRIVEGRWTYDAAEATVKRQASVAYPQLADQITQGMTVEDFFAPTKNRLAQVLDMNPNSIDLLDERWNEVTQLVDDNGNVRPMTYSEIGQYARGQDEYWSTDAANAKTYGVLNSVLDTMGVQ